MTCSLNLPSRAELERLHDAHGVVSNFSRALSKMQVALLEQLALLVHTEPNRDRGQLTLFQENALNGGATFHFGWSPRDPEHRETIIQEFLDAAHAHFEGELERLKGESPSPSLSQKKAIEGARWTMYHTRTLTKYLKEKYQRE